MTHRSCKGRFHLGQQGLEGRVDEQGKWFLLVTNKNFFIAQAFSIPIKALFSLNRYSLSMPFTLFPVNWLNKITTRDIITYFNITSKSKLNIFWHLQIKYGLPLESAGIC